MTDGVITDMNQTVDEIVELADHPISIVIIGVGEADFEQMDQLDADEAPLFSTKLQRYATRDIVQFVPFNKFAGS